MNVLDNPQSTNNMPSNDSGGTQIAGGALQMLSAQALNVPLGILTNAMLTRTLGPKIFGLFVVAGTLVTWFEVIAVRSLGRTSIKLIASSANWKQIASELLQLQFLIGLLSMAILYVTAPLLSNLVAEPTLTPYLQIIAFQIPLSALVRIHESTLLGLKYFGGRALMMAVCNLNTTE